MIVIGLLIAGFNVTLQAFWTIAWMRFINRWFLHRIQWMSFFKLFQILSLSVMYFTLLHILQAGFWALSYENIPATAHEFQSYWEALYFSLVTFTTLGYGDLYIHSSWRLLSGIEAVNGIMLIGWTTALIYSLIQRIFQALKQKTNE